MVAPFLHDRNSRDSFPHWILRAGTGTFRLSLVFPTVILRAGNGAKDLRLLLGVHPVQRTPVVGGLGVVPVTA